MIRPLVAACTPLLVLLMALGARAADETIPVAPMPGQTLDSPLLSTNAQLVRFDDEGTAAPVSCRSGCMEANCGRVAGCGCGCSCCWHASFDALFITRSTAKARTLAAEGGVPVLSTGELQFANEGGMAIQLGRATQFGVDIDVELSMIDWWSASRDVTGTGLRALGPYGVYFGGGDRVVARYGSSLYSTEVNLRKQSDCCWLKPFAGFRWIELHEDFALTMPETSGIFNPGTVQGTNAENHLYGFQLGANGLLLNKGRFQLEGVIKAGIFGNRATHDTFAFVEGGKGFTRDVRGETSRTAFVGELKFAGKYRISDCLSARAGYQLMWIDGVALAPNQFYTTVVSPNTATVHTNATPFYHGAFVGVELRR